MVEGKSSGADPALVPTISGLLLQYRDRTGASYDDMERTIGRAISAGRLHQLTTKPPDSFPRNPATVQHLADLLQVSVTTILESFAISLGLRVDDRSMLSLTLPPGTDNLTDRDRAAVLAVIRQMVEARRAAEDAETPDLSGAQGIRLAEERTTTNRDSQTTS